MMAEVHYFAEEMELYSPEGSFIGSTDFRLTIEIDRHGNWTVDTIDYRDGKPLHESQFGYALGELVKLSLVRAENKRHVRNIEDMVADARWQARVDVKTNAQEYWFKTRREGAV